jgi:hypothetical protein
MRVLIALATTSVAVGSARASECATSYTADDWAKDSLAAIEGVVVRPPEHDDIAVVRATRVFKGPKQKTFLISGGGAGLIMSDAGDRVRVFLLAQEDAGLVHPDKIAAQRAKGLWVWHASTCQNLLSEAERLRAMVGLSQSQSRKRSR